MTLFKTSLGRRSFIKSSVLAGGGMMLGFSWLAGCDPATATEDALGMPKEWFELNGFLKIGENGLVTIMSPNPEIGQNVKTAMPMIVAEELDVDWKNVVVEQAPLNTAIFTRQLAGGSQSIRQGWKSLRMAGATARHMLKEAAAQAWQVPVAEITTAAGVIYHTATNKSATYGEMASAAAAVAVPEEVELKDPKNFSIVGSSRKNVDGKKIVSGQPLFGLDFQREGMLIAMIAHPPAFGMKLKSLNADSAKAMPGIVDVFAIEPYKADFPKGWVDVSTFREVVVVLGKTTWEVMNAKKALLVEWEPFEAYDNTVAGPNDTAAKQPVPAGLESTAQHETRMAGASTKNLRTARRDGDPEAAFKNAAKVLERTYSAPFIAHNCMEPMNFFAHVTEGKAELAGPIQTPEFVEKSVSALLGIPLDNIDIQMTRMGGGFGRRLYGHFVVEAAVISHKAKAPVKLVYTREDDMTYGVYRPAYQVTYRAAFDAENQLTAFHVKAGGVPESPLFANRFPAGAVDNYLAEEWSVPSNITVGAWRAPRSNFIAGVEQAFLDEVAETMGKDPFELRLELLRRAQDRPVGENNDYDAARMAGVLELVREKSGWGTAEKEGLHRGVSAYFCHNSYVAQVLDIRKEEKGMVIEAVHSAADCGIVVNRDSAVNIMQGGVVDGIGAAMYGEVTFQNGVPQQNNFHNYRMIRHNEAPKANEVYFVDNGIDPTGLGEPSLPPVIGALANALYRAYGKRFYRQPFAKEIG